MQTFLIKHWSNIVLTSDGDVKDAQLYVEVRDQQEDGTYFDHIRAFKITGLEEVERTAAMGREEPAYRMADPGFPLPTLD